MPEEQTRNSDTRYGEEKKGNDIINAVKRLERAGTENSKTNQKLRAAAVVTANEIVKCVCSSGLAHVLLPGGYELITRQSANGVVYFLQKIIEDEDGSHGDVLNSSCVSSGYNGSITVATMDTVIQFARDIADGLLDEIAQFIEDSTKEASQALRTLNKENNT